MICHFLKVKRLHCFQITSLKLPDHGTERIGSALDKLLGKNTELNYRFIISVDTDDKLVLSRNNGD